MGYGRFVAMVATSTVVMFVLMYFNTYALEHVRFSETRVYMALLMGAAMAVIMLAFMFGMYKDRALNLAIMAVAGGASAAGERPRPAVLPRAGRQAAAAADRRERGHRHHHDPSLSAREQTSPGGIVARLPP